LMRSAIDMKSSSADGNWSDVSDDVLFLLLVAA